MVTATCLPTAHKAVNRSLYVALEMQEKWKNLELFLLKAESETFRIVSKMDTEAYVTCSIQSCTMQFFYT